VGLVQPPLEARHLTHLASQAHLSACHDIGTQTSVRDRRGHSQCQRQVRTGLGHLHPADRRDVDVELAQVQAGAPFEDRQEQRQAPGIDALRRPPRVRRGGPHQQCLQLDQQRSVPDHGGQHHGAGHVGSPVGEEQPAGIVDRPEAVACHLEQAELVGRSEPVLHDPEEPK